MAIACPVRLQGVIGGVYYFDAQVCTGRPTRVTANDTRDHTLGVDCTNVIDPLFVAIPLPEGDSYPPPFGCGCAYTGLGSYMTLKSAVTLAPGFDITAEHIVQYLDKNDDGQYVARMARLFLLTGEGQRKPILIGQELAPGTRVSSTLEGELKQPFGHYQAVMTGKGLAHIVTKCYLQPVPVEARVNGTARGRGRSKGKKRGGK